MKDPVRVSICPGCKGIVRAACPEYLLEDTSALRKFNNEVKKYNLEAKTISKEEYKKHKWHIDFVYCSGLKTQVKAATSPVK